MEITNIKDPLEEEEILSVIAYSQYGPTPEKLRGLAQKYQGNPLAYAFGCRWEKTVAGVILLAQRAPGLFEICAIATHPQYRNRGVGSKLISHAADVLRPRRLTAETDKEAVDFYRKYGFSITSLGEKYPGVVRFLCSLDFDR